MAGGQAEVFSGLDGSKVDMILDAMDEGTAKGHLYDARLRDLQELGFTPRQASDIAGCLLDLYLGAGSPDMMVRTLEGMDASEKARGAMIGALGKVMGRMAGPGRGAAPRSPRARGGKAREGQAAGPAADNSGEFYKFASLYKDDPRFRGRYVAFVNGRFQKSGPSQMRLVEEMYEKFGSVDMHVGKVAGEREAVFMGGPRLVRQRSSRMVRRQARALRLQRSR